MRQVGILKPVHPPVMGTTANKGTRGSLVRMRPDVVYYSWAVIDIEYLKVSESIWILTLDQIFFLALLHVGQLGASLVNNWYISANKELQLSLSSHVRILAITPLRQKTNTPDKKRPLNPK